MPDQVFFQDPGGSIYCFRHAILSSLRGHNIRVVMEPHDASGKYFPTCPICESDEKTDDFIQRIYAGHIICISGYDSRKVNPFLIESDLAILGYSTEVEYLDQNPNSGIIRILLDGEELISQGASKVIEYLDSLGGERWWDSEDEETVFDPTEHIPDDVLEEIRDTLPGPRGEPPIRVAQYEKPCVQKDSIKPTSIGWYW